MGEDRSHFEGSNLANHAVSKVSCLCMDMFGSTETGQRMHSWQLDNFNKSFVEQIMPHLDEQGLRGPALDPAPILKFTGDGWLLMTDRADLVLALCFLSVIMANRFQEEMSEATERSVDEIPPLRLAICQARDMLIRLPNGGQDWVGDSARRATRASQYCRPNEILIDESTKQDIFRDFDVEEVDLDKRPPECQCKKQEEQLSLYALGRPKTSPEAISTAPDTYLYAVAMVAEEDDPAKLLANLRRKGGHPNTSTYNVIIEKSRNYEEAKSLAHQMKKSGVLSNARTYNLLIDKSPDYDAALHWWNEMQEENVQPNTGTYNAMMTKCKDYALVRSWHRKMKEHGFQPNLRTYNILIEKSPDYSAALGWLGKMGEDSIQPNIRTLNLLMARSPDYDSARQWKDRMIEYGIKPNIWSYNIMIRKAPNYETAKSWLETLIKNGVRPNVWTYNRLIEKSPDYDEAGSWLEKMIKEGIKPIVWTFTALVKMAPDCGTVELLLKTMRKQDIQPSQNISGLVNDIFPHCEDAKALLAQLLKNGDI